MSSKVGKHFLNEKESMVFNEKITENIFLNRCGDLAINIFQIALAVPKQKYLKNPKKEKINK